MGVDARHPGGNQTMRSALADMGDMGDVADVADVAGVSMLLAMMFSSFRRKGGLQPMYRPPLTCSSVPVM